MSGFVIVPCDLLFDRTIVRARDNGFRQYPYVEPKVLEPKLTFTTGQFHGLHYLTENRRIVNPPSLHCTILIQSRQSAQSTSRPGGLSTHQEEENYQEEKESVLAPERRQRCSKQEGCQALSKAERQP